MRRHGGIDGAAVGVMKGAREANELAKNIGCAERDGFKELNL